MANFHTRSDSFPSQSHTVVKSVEDQLCRLKSSEAASTSSSSVCENLDGLRALHEDISNLIQLSSIQQALSHGQGQEFINEILEGSLRIVDLCEFARDIVRLTKESVQDLKSSIRRNKGETASAVNINSYIDSRNKIKKMINKYAKNLKSSNKNSNKEATSSDCDLTAIRTVLKEAEVYTLTTLKSVLTLISGEKETSSQRSWSLISKFTKASRVHSEVEPESSIKDLCSLNISKSQKGMDMQNMLKHLRASEMTIQELEEGLETLFRSLVKTRVSILNILSH
ncbi:uncharacterized protein LOC127246890 [Andrographis paniculata]|uniref:uncharacterized protein LOC127246890 n=1 Tax=Andrographis paniculata TaxID=175694 RepID=UPI0021E949C0|nr:uncharacterized protein LOC127246890 [Andrographis paniculata]